MVRIALASLTAAAVAAGAAGAGARQDYRTVTAQLTPQQVVRPGSLEPNARGSVVVNLDASAGRVCYTLTLLNIAPVTRFFIAQAPRGRRATELPIFIVPFDVSAVPHGHGTVKFHNRHKAYSAAYNHWVGVFTGSGCVSVDRSIVSQMVGDPAAFYLDVRTTTSDTGALRGQL